MVLAACFSYSSVEWFLDVTFSGFFINNNTDGLSSCFSYMKN